MPRTVTLPRRLPAGTKYVVEGRSSADGRFRVSARYLVYPDGSRVDLPGESVPRVNCGSPSASRARSRRKAEPALQLGA